MSSRERRVGRNEALFREVNERIREVTTYGGEVEVLCECGDAGCATPITMRLEEYEALRRRATRFAIVPGHESPDLERVVEQNDRFAVVEKAPGADAEIAVETDPRA
jgi:hypothetical protein